MQHNLNIISIRGLMKEFFSLNVIKFIQLKYKEVSR